MEINFLVDLVIDLGFKEILKDIWNVKRIWITRDDEVWVMSKNNVCTRFLVKAAIKK